MISEDWDLPKEEKINKALNFLHKEALDPLTDLNSLIDGLLFIAGDAQKTLQKIMRSSQVVRPDTVNVATEGSNPSSSATKE